MEEKDKLPSVNQRADADGDIQSVGNNNTFNVKQTFDKKRVINVGINIFRVESETLDQDTREKLLSSVQEYWVEPILAGSLSDTVSVELVIKKMSGAVKFSEESKKVNKYSWTIKRESLDEPLPAEISILEIFERIGKKRSLLILGPPGSGKTFMLMKLTHQLIKHARQTKTGPIPVVLHLSSWTEKLTIADWLSKQLKASYYVPTKSALAWIRENKLFLLLDGLDEVKKESRKQCISAINKFREENGLTSLVVCSRSQVYAELEEQLVFDGAIEIRSLTSDQVIEYVNQFGEKLAGLRQVLERDIALRQMAETILFLKIMIQVYENISSDSIFVSDNLEVQRKHLFDIYIRLMLEGYEDPKNEKFSTENVTRWLSWLARNMSNHNSVPYMLENMQPQWLSRNQQRNYKLITGLLVGLIGGLLTEIIIGSMIIPNEAARTVWISGYWIYGLASFLIFGLIGVSREINIIDTFEWNWDAIRKKLKLILSLGYVGGTVTWSIVYIYAYELSMQDAAIIGLLAGLSVLLLGGLRYGLIPKPIGQIKFPEQRIRSSIRNYFLTAGLFGLVLGPIVAILEEMNGQNGLLSGLISGLAWGLMISLFLGGFAILQHYLLRLVIATNALLPRNLTQFCDFCTERILLRRVGGGYDFFHSFMMEHFAAMYSNDEN